MKYIKSKLILALALLSGTVRNTALVCNKYEKELEYINSTGCKKRCELIEMLTSKYDPLPLKVQIAHYCSSSTNTVISDNDQYLQTGFKKEMCFESITDLQTRMEEQLKDCTKDLIGELELKIPSMRTKRTRTSTDRENSKMSLEDQYSKAWREMEKEQEESVENLRRRLEMTSIIATKRQRTN
jgi:hypothetical protein